MFIPLYAEHLYFLLSRCGWRVSRVYPHYTFEQSKFKEDFVIINQVSRQNAKTKVEKDFYKLMNNWNFGYNCRNNADNCNFSPIFDEIEELSYAKRYQNIFYENISDFVSSELLERQVEEEFLDKICTIDQQDEFYSTKKIFSKFTKKKNSMLYIQWKNPDKKNTKKTP